MAATRKPKADDGGARIRLIQANIQLFHDVGYAAATSRRVAASAGVKQALVYYYFPTMDDLFLEVLKVGADLVLEQMRSALMEDDPLRALWRINSDARSTVLNTEFVALANHRKAIGAELKAYAERVRDIETAAVAMVLRANGVDVTAFPPAAIAMLIAQTARSLANEVAVGVTQGHSELRALVERQMDSLTKPATTVRT